MPRLTVAVHAEAMDINVEKQVGNVLGSFAVNAMYSPGCDDHLRMCIAAYGHDRPVITGTDGPRSFYQFTRPGRTKSKEIDHAEAAKIQCLRKLPTLPDRVVVLLLIGCRGI